MLSFSCLFSIHSSLYSLEKSLNLQKNFYKNNEDSLYLGIYQKNGRQNFRVLAERRRGRFCTHPLCTAEREHLFTDSNILLNSSRFKVAVLNLNAASLHAKIITSTFPCLNASLSRSLESYTTSSTLMPSFSAICLKRAFRLSA